MLNATLTHACTGVQHPAGRGRAASEHQQPVLHHLADWPVTSQLLLSCPTWPHHSIMTWARGRPYIVAMVYTGEQPPVKFQPAGPDAPECFFISLDQCQYFKLESYCAPLHLGSWFFFFPSNNSLHSFLGCSPQLSRRSSASTCRRSCL